MFSNREITDKIMQAWDQKDESLFRQFVHKDYVSIDPMMSSKGIEAAVKKMHEFPFKGDLIVKNCIEDQNHCVIDGLWKVTHPFTATLPLMTINKFQNGKLIEKKILFDTALLPKKT